MEPVERNAETEAAGHAAVTVAGYVVIDEIGRGGMGIVYRAHDLKLGRVVALKRPKPELMERPDFAKRFLREARTASRLIHPNITTVFAAIEEDGVPWLVMELVEGSSLRDRLSSGRPLPVGEIIAHGEGLADALRAAHEHGIIHSDVNPNNILIGREGRARLTDFGLARARNVPGAAPAFGDGDVPTWSTPEAAGTRGYMAPEHLRGGALDPRSDVYCLGLVLYEMCTGQSVFAGKNTIEWVGAALEGETERLTKLGPQLPPELARIVAKATATEPRKRYQSAAAMAEDLRALRRFRESGFEIEVAAAARARKRTHYGVLAGVLLVSAAGASLLFHLRTQSHAAVIHPYQLTSAPGLEAHPAFSPDGRSLAYDSDESGNPDIWLVSVDGSNTTRLTDDSGNDTDPTWFPDGRTLAFVSDRSGVASVWTVPATGGRARLLGADAVDPAVSPDGSRIAFALRQSNGLTRIATAPVEEPTRISLLSPGSGFWEEREPAWSPDGRLIAYADFRDIWVIPATGGEAVRLTDGKGANREPAWDPDGRSIVCSSSREGARAIWRVPLQSGEPVRLTSGTETEASPVISRDGSRIAYATRREDSRLEIRDLTTGARRVVASSPRSTMPAVDPHGRFLVFVGSRLGRADLWRQDLDPRAPASPPRQLTDLPGTLAKPAVSPDGRLVAFHRVVDNERDIWAVPSAGGSAYPLVARPGLDIHPAFSPDGARMAFISDRAEGQHVWVVAFAHGAVSGEPRQVTAGSGTDLCPTWAPDGHRVAFIRHEQDDADLWLVDADSAAPPIRITSSEQIDTVQWDPGTEAILVACRRKGRDSELRRLRLSDGKDEPFTPPVLFGGPETWGAFSLSADRRTLCTTVASPTGDIWVAEMTP